MNDYLAEHHLLPRCQSAYRRFHGTETAMLRVLSDALTAADARQITLLGLLNMSAAFDCVDQSTWILRLERNFGVDDVIPHRSDPTSCVRSCTVQVRANAMRRPTRLGVGPAIFQHVHVRHQQSSRVSRSLQAASVRRRLPGLPQCSCNRGSNSCRPALSVRRQCVSVAELQPPASKSIEDACYLTGRKTSGDEGLR